MPYFSIVLPTRNRSDLVPLAVQSVLDQTFADWELLVCDNDDPLEAAADGFETATARALAAFPDARIRRIRTGGLPMADNWNAGFSASAGEYTLVMGDKYVLVADALARLHAVTEHDRPPVVYWNLGAITLRGGLAYLKAPAGTGAVTPHDPHAVLRAFTTALQPDSVPTRAYNTATHRGILDRMKREGPRTPCMRIAPDFSITYQQLAYADRLVHLDAVLSLASAAERGNGFIFVAKSNPAAAAQFVESNGGIDAFSSHVPIKTTTIEFSFLANDYLRIREAVGGRLLDYPMDMGNYFRVCLRELVRREILFGADMAQEWREWEAAFARQPAAVQAALADRARLMARDRVYWAAFRAARLALLPVRYARQRRAGGGYPSPLAAAQALSAR